MGRSGKMNCVLMGMKNTDFYVCKFYFEDSKQMDLVAQHKFRAKVIDMSRDVSFDMTPLVLVPKKLRAVMDKIIYVNRAQRFFEDKIDWKFYNYLTDIITPYEG